MKKKLFLLTTLPILALTSCSGGDIIKGTKMSLEDAKSYVKTNFADISKTEKEGTLICTKGSLKFASSGYETTFDKTYFPDITIDEEDNIANYLILLETGKEIEEDYIEVSFLAHEIYLNGSSFTIKSYISAEEYKDTLKESMDNASYITINEIKGDGLYSYYYFDEYGYISGKKITYDVYISLTLDLSKLLGESASSKITSVTSLKGEVIYSASWTK